MIQYGTGNLLESDAEALVNTVNTVGVMGKGIALMFKEAFPDNYNAYERACASKDVTVGRMFVTERLTMDSPRWIINFPTKKHWRHPSKLEWITEGLKDLKKVILENKIRSIAIPPLGAGNGGLEWEAVREQIDLILGDVPDVDILVYEPSRSYQNVSKRDGVQKLTPARAMVAEAIRRYWVLDSECSLIEAQKLSWFIERAIESLGLEDPLKLNFKANRYGPYADNLRHLLNSLDGSFLHCQKRISDADPLDVIWFEASKRDVLDAYFLSEGLPYKPVMKVVSDIIDGFQSPLGMEVLATVDWLLDQRLAEPTTSSVKAAIENWPAGSAAAQRKLRIFDDRLLDLAIARLSGSQIATAA